MQQQEQPQQKEQCFYFPAPKDGKIDKKEISQILENPEGENFSVSFSGKQIKIKTQNVENPEQKLEALKAKFGQDAKFLEEIPQPKKIIPTFFSNKQEPIQVNPILKEDIKNAVKDVTDYLTEKGTTFTGSDGRTYYKMSEQDEQNRQKAQQIFQNFLNKASEDDTIDNFFSQEFKSIKEALKETMTPEYIQKVRDQNGLTELYNSIKNFKNQEDKEINQKYDNRLRYLQNKYGEYDALDSYSYEAAVNATEREMQEALSDSEQRAKYQKLGLLSQYQELEDRLLYGKQNNNYKTF